MMENPEPTRHLLLDTNLLNLTGYRDDDELECLDLQVVDGEFVDARDMTDIEIT